MRPLSANRRGGARGYARRLPFDRATNGIIIGS
jgi:hypothetical protein